MSWSPLSPAGVDTLPAASEQPPSVTSTISLIQYLGIDGLITGTFQAYDPQKLTGTLVLGVGGSATFLPTINASAAPLAHVIAESPVVQPTVLADIAFATPAYGPDNGAATDIGIAATTAGFSGLVGPLVPALAGTTLGGELTPLLGVAGDVLTGLDKNGGKPKGGKPKGGTTHAAPYLTSVADFGLSTTTTVLGLTTATSAGAALALSKADGTAISAEAGDTANLLVDSAALLNDVQGGSLVGAVTEGVATLGAGAALGGAVTSLIADAGSGHATLAAVANPDMSLNLASGDSQSYALGLGTPLGVTEQLDVQITADKFGAYALGQVLAQVLPQVIADYNNGGVPNASSIFAQLAQGVSALSQNLLTTGGTAPGIPSYGNRADIQIQARLVTSQSQAVLGGTQTAAQTLSVGFDANAQGFYDLGTAAQPGLTDLLVAILETPQGQELLQVGGAILESIDSKLTGGGACLPEYQHTMNPMDAAFGQGPVHII